MSWLEHLNCQFPTSEFRAHKHLHYPKQSPSNHPIIIPQIDDLTFQGIGFCIDSQGYRYDSYYKTNFGSYQNCGASCIKNEAFRGLVIEDELRCRCLYEDGLLVIVSGMYDGYGMTVGGVGAVASSDGSANAKCYVFNWVE